MQAQPPSQNAVFSVDGYAVEQACAQHLRYGRFGSHYNGCGWMAAYNLLHALGRTPNADTVRADLARGLWFGGKLGTGPFRLARYLRTQGVQVHLTLLRSTAFRRTQTCSAGMLLYRNGAGGGAHYVAFAPLNPLQHGAAQNEAAKQTPLCRAMPPKTTVPESTAQCGQEDVIGLNSDARRILRFFNGMPGSSLLEETLFDFCIRACVRGPALFFTVD